MVTLAKNGIPRVGLVAMTAEQYHADPCEQPSLSSHIAIELTSKSPAHAHLRHPRLGGKRDKSTPDQEAGTLIHELILRSEDELRQKLVIVDADNWRKKADQEARDAARDAGKLPMLEREFDAARVVSVHVMARLLELGVRLNGLSEVAGFWEERASDGTVVQCRCMFDHVIRAEGLIYDLKKCRSAHPRAIQKAIEQYGYHVQASAYRSALEHIDAHMVGRVEFQWLFIEDQPPYVVVPAVAAGSMRRLGDATWRQAVDTWAHCMSTGQWPDYSTGGVVRVEASPWALERAITEDGEVAA